MHYAMTRNGSELPVHCFWVSGKNPKRTLHGRACACFERGDVIINEIEASWIGYRAQAVQPVFVEFINPVQAELIKVQREIFNRIMEVLKPGVTVAELAELTLTRASAPRLKPARPPARAVISPCTDAVPAMTDRSSRPTPEVQNNSPSRCTSTWFSSASRLQFPLTVNTRASGATRLW